MLGATNVLVYNTGIMAIPSPGTKMHDGFKSQLGVNHLVHFLTLRPSQTITAGFFNVRFQFQGRSRFRRPVIGQVAFFLIVILLRRRNIVLGKPTDRVRRLISLWWGVFGELSGCAGA
jgi:hypothetical protein